MFSGVYTALITPFKHNGKIDYAKLCELLTFQEDSDVQGVVILGTTGEEWSLNQKEKVNIIKLTMKILKSKKIIVGISGNSTQKMIDQMKKYDQLDFDGYLIGTPYYNKPSDMGLVQHFSKIANETKKSIILYNIPSRCGVNLSFELLDKLKVCKNIVSIKDASGDFDYCTKLISKYQDRYSVLCGNDNILLPMLSCGAKGCISVVSNILPSLPCKIQNNYALKLNLCTNLHNKYLKFINNLFLETNPICIKYVMHRMNFCEEVYRSPLCNATTKTKNALNKSILDIFLK